MPVLTHLRTSDAAKEFCSGEGGVSNVLRVQSLAILHKDHFDVTAQFQV